MTLLRQSSLAAVSAVVLTGSRFLLSALLARRMSVEAFGQFAYAQWLVDIAFLACSLGATGAVSRYVAEYRAEPRRLDAFLQSWQPWARALPMVGGAATLAGAWISGTGFELAGGLSLFAWSIANGSMALYTAALVGFQRFDLVLRSNLILAAMLLAGAAWVPIDSVGTDGLFGWMAVSNLLAAVPGWLVVRQLRRATSFTDLPADDRKAIKGYALTMWIVALLWSLVWSRGELPLVRAVLGDAAVAGYVAALTIFGGAVQGVMLGMGAVAPQLTRLIGDGKKTEAVELARKVSGYQLAICGLGASVLALLAPEIMTLAFGAKYRSGAATLAVLSIGLMPLALSAQNHILQIETNGKYSLITTLIGLALLAVFSVTLIQYYEITGVAMARATAISLVGLLSVVVMVAREGQGSIPLRQIVGTFLCALALVILMLMMPSGYWSDLVRYGICLVMVSFFTIIFYIQADKQILNRFFPNKRERDRLI